MLLSLICSLPFLLLWLAVGGFLLLNGLRAIQSRRITYKLIHPTGRMVIAYRGGAVRLVGAVQALAGLLLIGSLTGYLLGLEAVNAALGSGFCLSLPLYWLVLRAVSRHVEVQSRNMLR